MEPEHPLACGPCHVDGPPGRLWRGDQRIALRPQSLAMLRSLVAPPGRLVTKAEWRQHVWAGTHVTDTVLRVSVHEIRQALGAAAAAPRYLETVGRQGYRFLVGDALELRTALSLSRLWHQHGQRKPPATSWRRFMPGSPKAWTRLICRRPGRCLPR